MTANLVFEAIARLSGLVFVVTSMLAMGMGLTIAQIDEPLRNLRLVGAALVAYFVLVRLSRTASQPSFRSMTRCALD